MKLNKEDLMIGDWVMIKDYPMISEPKRMTENHFVRSLCEFEAIPITKEFLLKNGFEFLHSEKTENKGTFYLKTEHCLLAYTNGYNVIQIYKSRIGGIDTESKNCIRRNDRYEINCEQFPIEYVHELQHILRLAKIDIEIKL